MVLSTLAGRRARPALGAGREAVPVRPLSMVLPPVLEALLLALVVRFFPRAVAPAFLAQFRHYQARVRALTGRAPVLDLAAIATALRACRRRGNRLRAIIGWVRRRAPALGMAAPRVRPHGRIAAAQPVRPARAPPAAA